MKKISKQILELTSTKNWLYFISFVELLKETFHQNLELVELEIITHLPLVTHTPSRKKKSQWTHPWPRAPAVEDHQGPPPPALAEARRRPPPGGSPSPAARRFAGTEARLEVLPQPPLELLQGRLLLRKAARG